jgi:hypothetical protein
LAQLPGPVVAQHLSHTLVNSFKRPGMGGVAQVYVSIVFYTHWKCQTNELLLWDRPISFFVSCFTRTGQYQTNELLLWDRPNSCFLFCLARIGQYQTNELLLWDRPISCFLLRFTHTLGDIRLTSCFCGIARIHVFYYVLHALGQYQTTNCFCGIARVHVSIVFLFALGQYQTNELRLGDRPNSCCLLCFTCIGVISD